MMMSQDDRPLHFLPLLLLPVHLYFLPLHLSLVFQEERKRGTEIETLQRIGVCLGCWKILVGRFEGGLHRSNGWKAFQSTDQRFLLCFSQGYSF